MRYRTLGATGLNVSVLGFGGSPLGDIFQAIEPAEAQRAVHQAVDCGINLFDVSPYYGETLAESRLGEALAGRRDKIVLSTKCGRYGKDNFDFSAERISKSIDESLLRLRTGYVDLLLAHDVEFGSVEQIVAETIPALREIQRAGKARFIGITGYNLGTLRAIASRAPVDAILSYCRYNLMVTDMDELLTPFAREQSIGLINASPLHMGLLSGYGTPEWHPAPQQVKQVGKRVSELCKEQGLDPAVVALRFCLDHPYVSSTLVGMTSARQVIDNLRALEGTTDPALLAKIAQIVSPVKNVAWPSGRPENADAAQL